MVRRVFGGVVVLLAILMALAVLRTSRPDIALLVFDGLIVAAGVWMMVAKNVIPWILKPICGFLTLLLGVSILGNMGYEILTGNFTPQRSLFWTLFAICVAVSMIYVGYGWMTSKRAPVPEEEQPLDKIGR